MGSVIGVDIGGSKTHGVRAVDGRPVAEALAGSANLASVGTAEAARQLRALIARLGADGVDAVCAGAAVSLVSVLFWPASGARASVSVIVQSPMRFNLFAPAYQV